MEDKLTKYIVDEISKFNKILFPYEKTQEGQLKLFDQKLGELVRGNITKEEFDTFKSQRQIIDDRVSEVERIADDTDAINAWNKLLDDPVSNLDERGTILAYQDLIMRYGRTNLYEKELQARLEMQGKLGVEDNSVDKYWRERWIIKKIGLENSIK